MDNTQWIAVAVPPQDSGLRYFIWPLSFEVECEQRVRDTARDTARADWDSTHTPPNPGEDIVPIYIYKGNRGVGIDVEIEGGEVIDRVLPAEELL